MIRSFRHRGLKCMYERNNPSRASTDIANRVEFVLADLDSACKPSNLDLPGYRLHPLKGNPREIRRIPVLGNWRMLFRFDNGDVYDVNLVDHH